MSIPTECQVIPAERSNEATKTSQLNEKAPHAIVGHPYRYRYRPQIDITGSAIVYT